MEQFFGYIWTISELVDDGEAVADVNDRFVIFMNKQDTDTYRYHVMAPDQFHKVGGTLGTCTDWRYDPLDDYMGRKRDVLRGTVSLPDHHIGDHNHHVLMVYPDPYRPGEVLSGFVLDHAMDSIPTEVLLNSLGQELTVKESGQAGPMSHGGTYHSED